MNKIKYILLALTVFIYTGCEEEVPTPEGTNYIAFADSEFSTGVDVGSSNSFDIPVYSANITGSDRSFDILVDPASAAAAGSYTVPSTVTIPSGSNEGTLTVQLTDTNLGIGVNKLILNFGVVENLYNGGSTTVNYIQNCTEITATLEINFDGYGSESSWSITDALGGIVVSKAEKFYADGQASATETITLCAGRDYTFTFNDAYGDGLSYPADGNVTLTINGEEKAAVTGDFGTKYEVAFDTN